MNIRIKNILASAVSLSVIITFCLMLVCVITDGGLIPLLALAICAVFCVGGSYFLLKEEKRAIGEKYKYIQYIAFLEVPDTTGPFGREYKYRVERYSATNESEEEAFRLLADDRNKLLRIVTLADGTKETHWWDDAKQAWRLNCDILPF